MSDGLEGFAEAHVVGEDAVEAVSGEELHPAEAVGLVVAQGGLEDGGCGEGLEALEVGEFLGEFVDFVRRIDAEAVEAGEGGGVEGVEAGFAGEFRVDEGGEVAEDAADTAGGELEGVAIGEGGVDVAGIGAVEGFFEKVVFEQAGEDGEEVVFFPGDVEADGEREPAAIAWGEVGVPGGGVGIEDAVAYGFVEGDGPAEGFELGCHFAAELMPEGIGWDAGGIGEPAVGDGFFFAGGEVEEELPGGVVVEGREAGFLELAGGGVFGGGDFGGGGVAEDAGVIGEVDFGGGGDPGVGIFLAEGLEEEGEDAGDGGAADVEVEGGGGEILRFFR